MGKGTTISFANHRSHSFEYSSQQLSRFNGHRSAMRYTMKISHPTNLFAYRMKFVPIFFSLFLRFFSRFHPDVLFERALASIWYICIGIPFLFKRFIVLRCVLFIISSISWTFFLSPCKHHSIALVFHNITLYICSIHAISIYTFLMVFAFNLLFFRNQFESTIPYFSHSYWHIDTKRNRHLTSNWNIFLLTTAREKIEINIKCVIIRTLSLHTWYVFRLVNAWWSTCHIVNVEHCFFFVIMYTCYAVCFAFQFHRIITFRKPNAMTWLVATLK